MRFTRKNKKIAKVLLATTKAAPDGSQLSRSAVRRIAQRVGGIVYKTPEGDLEAWGAGDAD